VCGMSGKNRADDTFLSLPICIGHEIDGGLVVDPEACSGVIKEDLARCFRRLDSRGEIAAAFCR